MAYLLLRKVQKAAYADGRQRVVYIKFSRYIHPGFQLIPPCHIEFKSHKFRFAHVVNLSCHEVRLLFEAIGGQFTGGIFYDLAVMLIVTIHDSDPTAA